MQNISFGSFEFFISDFGSLGFGYVAGFYEENREREREMERKREKKE